MGVFQDKLDEAIENLPRQALEVMVARKLQKQGYGDPNLAARIADAIFNHEGTEGRISIDCDTGLEDVNLDFTDDDLAQLTENLGNLIEKMPEIFRDLSDGLGGKVADELLSRWEMYSGEFQQARDDLARRIDADWGRAFGSLRALTECCRELGDKFNLEQMKSRLKRNQLRNELLGRLHIRACRITDEIVTLLEAGFAEGAIARWRTLYETAVVATLIAEGGDSLAARYVDHEAVERKRALDDHIRAASVRDLGSPSASERNAVNRAFERAKKKHGGKFAGMYGWASGQLGLPDELQFHHLQELAGTLEMKLQYRLASFGCHASMHALFQPVHRWDPTLNVPGVFEAGFQEPGINTAHALTLITSLLGGDEWDMDRLVEVSTLVHLRDEASNRMSETAKSLARKATRQIERARPRRFGWVKSRPR